MRTDEMLCPDCAETIKHAARVCRFCNREIVKDEYAPTVAVDTPRSVATRSDETWLVGKLIIVVTIVAIGIYIFIEGYSNYKTLFGKPVQANEIQEIAKQKVTAEFLDPASAQFRGLDTTAKCVIGEVNGKNAYGAYIGYKNFYYRLSDKLAKIDPELPNPDLNSSAEYRKHGDQFIAFQNEYAACI